MSLGDGRSRFRHDLVLSALRDGITEQLERAKSLPPRQSESIPFVRAGALQLRGEAILEACWLDQPTGSCALTWTDH